ncbi:peptidylprolyl isomerase [Holophaga foetida]|uniref:peptidylprolyl isomerase n=1 Tax=Holophaga foetida TaxID=35839 RepID=UPI000247466A|nr:peptidylprolyl isomerase [Holophaga foetida]
MRFSLLCLSLCALTLPSCARSGEKAKAPAAVEAPTAHPPVPTTKPRVKFMTSYGPIVVELEPALAPATVANFLRYVKEGHYAGTIFHRVIPGFMIQGGGFTEDMAEKSSHEPIQNEAPSTSKGGLRNTRGTIAMARTGEPHSATAQFYINTVDNPALDYKASTGSGYGYCAFGRVVEGMEAVDKIEKVRTGWRQGMQDVPEYAMRIKAAELLPEK